MKRLIMGLALASAGPVAARDLPVPAEKGWRHAQTGLTLMYRLADLTRTSLTDATTSEHDVAAQFDSADKNVFATIYLFRPAVPDVAMWFDRSRSALETRDLFRDAAPATIDPIGFAVGGAPTASSLRQSYALAGGRYRSTALAAMPVGNWIATIRVSSRTLSAAQLDAKLLGMISAIQWPAQTAPAPQAVASPIKPCGTQLMFKKARQVKPDGSDMLMSLIAGAVAAEKAGAAPEKTLRSWCQEGDGRPEYGVYRSGGPSNGYVLAVRVPAVSSVSTLRSWVR